MAVLDRLAALLPPGAARLLSRVEAVTEVRLRAGRPVQVVGMAGEALSEENLDAEALHNILAALMEHSVYARQGELDQGFFTLGDGSRVGVCGRVFMEKGKPRLAEIGSACVRVARAVQGCADGLMDELTGPAGPRSALVLSQPGLGKTTLLRDIARQLSNRGYSVAVADERHELAACHLGVPTLDVGPRTDVTDGCPKAQAILRMLRAMAPRVIVADEIGGAADARALMEAARCGVPVIASAHADGLDSARARADLGGILASGILERAVLLGPRPGAVRGVWKRGGEGEAEWIPA